MKILYVEDNPANVFLVKRVARMGNHEIINYIDGNQALRKFDEISPDLVLMDIQLAGDKSGLDVVRELRSRGVETPIIAVTAYAMVGDRERCIEAGCDDYLAKPLPIPRLVEMFQSYQEQTTVKQPKATVELSAVPEKASDDVSTNTDDTHETVSDASDDVSTNTDDTHETVSDASDETPTSTDDTHETVSEASDETPTNTDDTHETVSDASDETPVSDSDAHVETVSDDLEASETKSASDSENHDMITAEPVETIEEAKTGE